MAGSPMSRYFHRTVACLLLITVGGCSSTTLRCSGPLRPINIGGSSNASYVNQQLRLGLKGPPQ
jgi:hypothetical protein